MRPRRSFSLSGGGKEKRELSLAGVHNELYSLDLLACRREKKSVPKRHFILRKSTICVYM